MAWFGSTPDGVVFNPLEDPLFGLAGIKCPNVKSYVDYLHLKKQIGKENSNMPITSRWLHGQVLITGMQWCASVVSAEEDTLIQRIYTQT